MSEGANTAVGRMGSQEIDSYTVKYRALGKVQRQSSGGKITSSITSGTGPCTSIKISSKWIIGLNVRNKTTRLVEDDITENLGNWFAAEILATTPNTQSMKEKTDECTLLK